ncbi:MAG: hypothetical protein RR821_11220, partial [Clostridia bacterium]
MYLNKRKFISFKTIVKTIVQNHRPKQTPSNPSHPAQAARNHPDPRRLFSIGDGMPARGGMLHALQSACMR